MNFPPDPWELLELDRSASGEREVKRAYARLLKRHRPDQDPEGFQRVSEAYHQALRDVREDLENPSSPAGVTVEPPVLPMVPEAADSSKTGDGSAGTESGPDGDLESNSNSGTSGPPDEAEAAPAPRRLEDFPDLPEKFLSGCERLRQRLRRVAQAPESPEFNMLRNMVREDPAALAAPWVVVLDALFQTERGLRLLPQIHAQDVLLLMGHGEGGCAARILMTWREEITLLNRLTQLANLMLDQKIANDPAMLRAMHFTAQMAAFHLPHIASRLADELYRQTGPGVREQIVREIELRSAAGKVFAAFSLPHRRVWEHQLFESGDGEADWSRPENMSALQSVIAGCGQEWEGWPLVTRVVPEPVLNQTLAQVRQAQAAVRPKSKRDWLPSGRWAFVILWAAAHLLSAVFKDSSPQFSAEERERLEETGRRIAESRAGEAGPSGFKTAQQTELDRMQEKLDQSRSTTLNPFPDTFGTPADGPGSGSVPDTTMAPPAGTQLRIPASDFRPPGFSTPIVVPSSSASPGGNLNVMDSFGK
ncbi:MAG: J domain-containing protein [Verrucomicrobiota bacterium]